MSATQTTQKSDLEGDQTMMQSSRVSEYIEDMTRQLEVMAAAQGLEKLKTLLAAARTEARRNAYSA